MLDRLHTELQSVPGAVSQTQTPTSSKMKNFVCPSTAKKGSSFVTNIFGGTLLSEVRCLSCSSTSKKHDPFLDLSLDIPEKYYNDIDEDGKKPECHISDCLSSFVAVEELTETELYYCSNCKMKQRSTKRFWIRRLPNVLCLHIKRFRWNSYYR
jgi:ubiquitin carboxyl-terminal hydrolase 3